MNNACCPANAEATRAVELARKKRTAEEAELPEPHEEERQRDDRVEEEDARGHV